MKKSLIISLVIIVTIGGIVGSLYMMSKSSNKSQEKMENYEVADKVTDECIEEYNELETAKVEETNSEEEEKISPNAVITFEKFYNGCEHTTNRYEEVSSSLVNATKEEVEKKYDKWKIKEFSKDKIVLYQELDGECGEHYMLRDVDGKINIYKLDENGNETLINETDIATEYLTETDMINMENGLIVYGKENLNKLLEDFE